MSNSQNETIQKEDVMKMAVDIVSAYVSNNSLPSEQIPEVLQSTFKVLSSLQSENGLSSCKEAQKPAVPVRKSVTPDYLICLEDGKKLKMLKRHLRTNYGMTPEDYKAKWGLPADYPIVAPNYAVQRSEFAKRIGLGRKPKS